MVSIRRPRTGKYDPKEGEVPPYAHLVLRTGDVLMGGVGLILATIFRRGVNMADRAATKIENVASVIADDVAIEAGEIVQSVGHVTRVSVYIVASVMTSVVLIVVWSQGLRCTRRRFDSQRGYPGEGPPKGGTLRTSQVGSSSSGQKEEKLAETKAEVSKMLKDILPRGLREGEEPRRGLTGGTLRTHSQSQGSAQREEVGVKGDARAAPSHEPNKSENELR